jgi:AcrR family transcriptional regulator
MMDKKQNIESLHDQVLTLYRKYGIRSVTMDDVSRNLGISKKTLYQLVEDKYDLIRKVLHHEEKASLEGIDRIQKVQGNAIDELIRVNELVHLHRGALAPNLYYDLQKYYPQLFRDWIERKHKRMYDLVISNLRKGKEEGLYRQELDENAIARLYLSRVESLNGTVLQQDEPPSLPDIRELFIYHIHGICNSKGLEYFSGNLHQFNRVT